MRANKLQQIIITVRSIWLTFIVSANIIWWAQIGQCTRKNIDKISRSWARGILDIVKLSVHIQPYKTEYLPGKCYIVMSNHSSHYDIPLILHALPGSIRMIGKKELFKVPVWGRALHLSEMISIDRKNRRQAILDLRIAREKMQSGIIPWIAPEGTRSRDGELQEFKKGGFLLAIQTGATIIPVRIDGSFAILPPKTTDFMLHGKVSVNVKEPIDASKYTVKDLNELMRVVRERMIEA